MTQHNIDSERFVRLAGITAAMLDAGLAADFCKNVLLLASHNEGVADLVELWNDSREERDEVVADLEELLNDAELPEEPTTRPKVPFNDLPNVLDSVKKHKAKLRDLIDRHGGVSEVARKSGIPQPSLSRMLSSGSMPRRTTLYKIANALNVSEAEIVGEWVR